MSSIYRLDRNSGAVCARNVGRNVARERRLLIAVCRRRTCSGQCLDILQHLQLCLTNPQELTESLQVYIQAIPDPSARDTTEVHRHFSDRPRSCLLD